MEITSEKFKRLVEAKRKLDIWEDKKRKVGTNYVIEQRINKYKNIIDEITSPQIIDSKSEAGEVVIDEEGQIEKTNKKIKQLERRIRKGTATWQDRMLLDCYKGR